MIDEGKAEVALDRVGITRRDGDLRVLGEAKPSAVGG